MLSRSRVQVGTIPGSISRLSSTHCSVPVVHWTSVWARLCFLTRTDEPQLLQDTGRTNISSVAITNVATVLAPRREGANTGLNRPIGRRPARPKPGWRG